MHQIGRTAIGTAIALKIAKSGYKKGSLNRSGSIAAFAVAAAAFSCSFRCGATLICFYATGSKLTKVGASTKMKLEDDYAAEGDRGAKQVLACSLFAVLCGILRRIFVGVDSPLSMANFGYQGNRLTLAYVAFFACCAGDTWASELGVLAKQPPRLVTMPWRTVVPGTNGGVSLAGTLASATGGAAMGLCHGLLLPLAPGQWIRDTYMLTVVGLASGLFGSLLDSLLGATLQATYYDTKRRIVVKKKNSPNTENCGGWAFFSNEAVNVVSTIATAVLAALWTPFILQSIS
ncbi:Transmembrane protein 19 [Seminavis robusta]|uniref:Transmembrane protein 19 n=1 Tax=Seminavis robusta TaxID=568900 RepID=A0A9N8HL12_9STRA|nr:Transmembrane protein 19 [Seminavis robusta]|eukprot:Sro879_g214900.1 Transmembrane protein 19 (290) ;mRNA; f:33637-34597